MKKVETGGRKVGELVQKIQINEPKVGSRGVSENLSGMRCWQRLVRKNGFIKCFDDITGKELPWQAVNEAREKRAEASA